MQSFKPALKAGVIADEELRALFKAESEEHLEALEDGLLRLEADPSNVTNLELLFREAHSLKGAARMLGVADVERVAHHFEDALDSARRGEIALLDGAGNRMHGALGAIRKLVDQAVTGDPSGVDVDQIIKTLDGEELPAADAKPTETSTAAYRMETMRVESRRLDALMTYTGELLVATHRIARRASLADEVLSIWEDWSKTRSPRPEKLGVLLRQLREGMDEDSARLDFATNRLDEGVRAVRLLPFSTIFNMFRRLVRDIAAGQKKEVEIVIVGGSTVADKRVLEEMKAPLTHLVRNAVDHGIESPAAREARGKPRAGTIRLSASQLGSSIVIELADDGQGLNLDAIRSTAIKRGLVRADELDRMTEREVRTLIFKPGFSTSAEVTEISGRGVGLDVVRTHIEKLKGTIIVESAQGAGCTIRVQLPATLATSRVLIVDVLGASFALPLEHVLLTRYVLPEDVYSVGGRASISVNGRPVPLVRLADLLELPGAPGVEKADGREVCVLVVVGEEVVAAIVDELLDEQEVILKSHGNLLRRVRNVSGAAILATGTVCTVLNPLDLMRSGRQAVLSRRTPAPPPVNDAKPKVLLVEDSITTRTWEKRGLEAAGYEVVTAADGFRALHQLSLQPFDAVVSDIQMPNMDGFALTEKIRQDRRLAELPVILVTSLADDNDRRRGIEVGASAYIAKSSFDQKLLVETLKRIV